MSVIGVAEVVEAPEVFGGRSARPQPLQDAGPPRILSIAISAAAIGLAVVNFGGAEAGIALRGERLAELEYVAPHRQPTASVSEALAVLRTLADSFGHAPAADPELVHLAKAAVSGAGSRRNENVDEWARALAADVVNAND